jgi:fructokinase
LIAVVGEALVDLVSEDGDSDARYHAVAGGSPFNVAIAAARLDVATRLYSRIGADAYGQLLLDAARRDGVDVSGVIRNGGSTGSAVTTIDEFGAARYDFRIDDAVGPGWAAFEPDGLAEASIIHFGSIASWREPGDAVIRAAVQDAHALVTYDPNIRPVLLSSRNRARDVIERNVAVSDVVKASDEDLAWLYPGLDEAVVADRWLGSGPSLVVVTAGDRGATAYRSGRPALHRPAFPVEVVDTVGAGDSGMATLLCDLHRREITSAAALAAVADEDVVSMLDDALLTAALTCARRGSDPPTVTELNQARAHYQPR